MVSPKGGLFHTNAFSCAQRHGMDTSARQALAEWAPALCFAASPGTGLLKWDHQSCPLKYAYAHDSGSLRKKPSSWLRSRPKRHMTATIGRRLVWPKSEGLRKLEDYSASINQSKYRASCNANRRQPKTTCLWTIFQDCEQPNPTSPDPGLKVAERSEPQLPLG